MEHITHNNKEKFHDKLREKMDAFAHLTYQLTRKFPKEELYGITSQLRRAALSIILNYIEGFARQGEKIYNNFLNIAYGSLKEVKYLLHFSMVEKYLTKEDYQKILRLAEEIGAMLWSTIKTRNK